MSIQEVATMVKTGVCPYLFVINNDGYVGGALRFVSSLTRCGFFFTTMALPSLALNALPARSRSYEIERQIHGVKAKYNDIQMIDHQMMLPFFVGKSVRPAGRFAYLKGQR